MKKRSKGISQATRVQRHFKPKLGDHVLDRWWYDFGIGTVIRCAKTQITIRFAHGTLVYDRAHYKFLENIV